MTPDGITTEMPRLGRILPAGSGRRDAVHVALLPCVAGETLRPGQKAMVLDAKRLTFASADADEWAGVVDPFLPFPVLAGQEFWLLMPPGSITSLRHVWTHPKIDGPGWPVPDIDRLTRLALANDWLALAALGDLLTEAGDEVAATGLHWCAEHHKRPEGNPGIGYFWYWGNVDVLPGEKMRVHYLELERVEYDRLPGGGEDRSFLGAFRRVARALAAKQESP